MAELGADDPDAWARSELQENIAQQARYLVLRCIWRDTLSPWRDPGTLRHYEMLAELVQQGTDENLLAQAVRNVVYETLIAVIGVIDRECDPEAPDDAPGWRLMETAAADLSLTGRDVGGLHESLLETDPLGREAADFF